MRAELVFIDRRSGSVAASSTTVASSRHAADDLVDAITAKLAPAWSREIEAALTVHIVLLPGDDAEAAAPAARTGSAGSAGDGKHPQEPGDASSDNGFGGLAPYLRTAGFHRPLHVSTSPDGALHLDVVLSAGLPALVDVVSYNRPSFWKHFNVVSVSADTIVLEPDANP